MDVQVAYSDAAAQDYGSVEAPCFKERGWVAGVMFFVDVTAVETALFLGVLSRSALSSWWPINISPITYVGLIGGVLVLPVAYYMVGLHPGYGLGGVERLRWRVTTTICVFGALIA